MLRHRNHHRHAYTLMEIVCVLAVLVIVAAITIPTIRSLMADTSMDAASDAVLGVVADTRARALEDGRPWKLGFIANTGVFQIAPEESTEWDNPTQELNEKTDLRRDALPKDIVFATSHDDIMGREQAQQA